VTDKQGSIALGDPLLQMLTIWIRILSILHLELVDISSVVTKTSWTQRLFGLRISDLSWSHPLNLGLIISFNNRAFAD
jgi:hypothetical protein